MYYHLEAPPPPAVRWVTVSVNIRVLQLFLHSWEHGGSVETHRSRTDVEAGSQSMWVRTKAACRGSSFPGWNDYKVLSEGATMCLFIQEHLRRFLLSTQPWFWFWSGCYPRGDVYEHLICGFSESSVPRTYWRSCLVPEVVGDRWLQGWNRSWVVGQIQSVQVLLVVEECWRWWQTVGLNDLLAWSFLFTTRSGILAPPWPTNWLLERRFKAGDPPRCQNRSENAGSHRTSGTRNSSPSSSRQLKVKTELKFSSVYFYSADFKQMSYHGTLQENFPLS